MKNIIPVLSIILILFAFNGYSQVNDGEIEKLRKLYSEGKYESCMLKADDYTYKDDYSRDPEPYLYISMSFYQISISEDPDLQYDYKDALKQSIKYGTKFVRKDKNDVLYSKNIDFINLLKDEQKSIIKKQVDIDKFSKAASAAKVYNKLNRNTDNSLLYFTGVNEILSRNYSQGLRNVDLATEELNKQISSNTVVYDSRVQAMVISSFLKYSEYLVKDGKLGDANKCLELGSSLFPDDGYINVQANMVKKAIAGKTKAATQPE